MIPSNPVTTPAATDATVRLPPHGRCLKVLQDALVGKGIREVQDGEVVFEAGDRRELFVLESCQYGALLFLFASCFSLHRWRHCTTPDCPTGHGTSEAEFQLRRHSRLPGPSDSPYCVEARAVLTNAFLGQSEHGTTASDGSEARRCELEGPENGRNQRSHFLTLLLRDHITL